MRVRGEGRAVELGEVGSGEGGLPLVGVEVGLIEVLALALGRTLGAEVG